MAGSVKKRRAILWGLSCAVFIAGACLLYSLVFAANKQISPDNRYQTAYNRITKVITLRAAGSDAKSYFGECEDPALLWSPNSEFLAMTSTGRDGNRRSEILKLEHNSSLALPTKLDLQAISGQAQTADESAVRIEVTKWLDNDNVLVEFSWPPREPGQSACGWFIFEVSSYTVKQLTFSQ